MSDIRPDCLSSFMYICFGTPCKYKSYWKLELTVVLQWWAWIKHYCYCLLSVFFVCFFVFKTVSFLGKNSCFQQLHHNFSYIYFGCIYFTSLPGLLLTFRWLEGVHCFCENMRCCLTFLLKTIYAKWKRQICVFFSL